MSGEANHHAMHATHVPATDDELDSWVSRALQGVGVNPLSWAAHAVARLVQEVILLRSLCRIEKERKEEATRRERANAVLLQRAEARATELQRQLDDMTTEKNRLLSKQKAS